MPIECTPGNLISQSHCLESCLMEDQLQAIQTWLLTQIAGVPDDPGSLLNASKCLLDCLETGQLLTIKAWLATKLAGDPDSAEVISLAKCFEGCLTARQQDSIQAWLLAQKAGVSADATFLFDHSKCLFDCLTWQQQLAIQVYLMATKVSVPINAGSLMEGARCFIGCLTEEQAQSVTTLELCHWANSGGGCPTITLQPDALPDGTCGTAYSQLITAIGGTAPYTFAVTAGALPGGYSLAPDGTLSGTLNSTGTFNFTVTATDAVGCTGSKDYSLVIDPVVMQDSSVVFGDFAYSPNINPLLVTVITGTGQQPFSCKFTSPEFSSTGVAKDWDIYYTVTIDPCFVLSPQPDYCLLFSDGLGIASLTIETNSCDTGFDIGTCENDSPGVVFAPDNDPDDPCQYSVFPPTVALQKFWVHHHFHLVPNNGGNTAQVTSFVVQVNLV